MWSRPRSACSGRAGPPRGRIVARALSTLKRDVGADRRCRRPRQEDGEARAASAARAGYDRRVDWRTGAAMKPLAIAAVAGIAVTLLLALPATDRLELPVRDAAMRLRPH